jgi:2-hydroxychromene-2-carboxylate isomerase
MPKTLEFFFDFASTYSYLASTQVEALAARHDARLAYRPMVIGAVFKATGNDMPARIPAKARYMRDDMVRWSEYYGVPFKMSSHWPANTVKAMRLVLVGEDEGKAGAVVRAAFHAMWADDQDLTADATLRAVAASAGLDADHALAAIESAEVKDRLRKNTDEAIARGAFGAPALFVGDQLFWGNDRLHFVEAALAGG